MPRRHPRVYQRPKPIDETIADLQSEFAPAERAPPERVPIDYRPIVAVIAIVIFSLALIAFLFTLRASR
jgi:hypothetical protein